MIVLVDECGAIRWLYPENCAAVIIPDVFRLSCVPIPEVEPPINLPVDAWYWRTLPSTFALSSSTSSSFKRLTSPDPGPCARTLYNISLTCLISALRLSTLVSSAFSTSSLIFVSSINLIACATVSLIFGVLMGSGLIISTISNEGSSSTSSKAVSYTHLRAHETG